MVRFFWTTVSLPLNQLHHEWSRALTRRTAGPSLTPLSFDASTAILCSLVGWAYCSAASVCSAPPVESVAVTDFRPAPRSLTTISMGASPSTSASGASRICGGSRSKRGHRYQVPARSPMVTIEERRRTVRFLLGVPDSKAVMSLGGVKGPEHLCKRARALVQKRDG